MDTSTDAVQRYCMKLKKDEMRTSIKLFTTIFTLALLFSCYGKEDDRLFAIEKDTRVRDNFSMKRVPTALIFLHIPAAPPAYSQKSNMQ